MFVFVSMILMIGLGNLLGKTPPINSTTERICDMILWYNPTDGFRAE